MTKKLFYFALIGLSINYVNCYSKVYAQSHEKRVVSEFMLPVACHYGEDCWAVNYVDVDPAEYSSSDYKCESITYDGHKGVDFALGSIRQMREGVNVLAAAAGKVSRVRDGQSDALKSEQELEDIRRDKKECGNGILIDHGGGLKTIYCQLKEGSVVVKPRQRVRAGQKIAQVGQSGLAEFPHLHFGVFQDGIVLDPYTGAGSEKGCAAKGDPMWLMGLPMSYEPVAIFDGGFGSATPDFEVIKRGGDMPPTSLPSGNGALVFWVGLYNAEAGDKVEIDIFDPAGKLFDTSTQTSNSTRKQKYFYTGRKGALEKGTYSAKVKFSRSGGPIISKVKEFSVNVE